MSIGKGAKLYIHKSSWTQKHFFIFFHAALCRLRREKNTTIANNSNKFQTNKTFVSTSYKYVH